LTDFKRIPLNILTPKFNEIKDIILSNEKISAEFSVEMNLDDVKNIDNLVLFLKPLFKQIDLKLVKYKELLSIVHDDH
jgi:hypothetical protein